MLKIKLSPIGKKHAIKYRIVVTEGKSKITGRVVDQIGHYTPAEGKINADTTKVKDWMKKGAQPTPTIRKLLSL